MKTIIKSLAIAAALSMTAGAALAAEQSMKDCCAKCECCKDMHKGMHGDMQKPDAKPGAEQAPEHQH
ncbi:MULTISPECIES: hypothetical protein [Phenylobacterium]|uniref:Pentapeptide MXKDX repeat protein n=1 Tax=Phenylobacterium koreense TaxID=266125 RepID=A0ABV2EEX4_9CAUL